MKTAELTGADLDAWVAKADGRAFDIVRLAPQGIDFVTVVDTEQSGWVAWSPSRLWQDGGPIIEREGINSDTLMDESWKCYVHIDGYEASHQEGATLLIAAMRAFVASVFGPDVDATT